MPENTTEETRQPSIESVTAENTRLQGELDATKSKLATAKSELEATKGKLTTAKNDLAAAKNEFSTAKSELKAANEVIAGQALAIQNAESAAAASDTIVVTHEGQQYRVLGKKFKVKGQEVKAEELSKNPEALKHLVDSKSGLLVLITKEEAAK